MSKIVRKFFEILFEYTNILKQKPVPPRTIPVFKNDPKMSTYI